MVESVSTRDLERGPSHVPRRDGEGRLQQRRRRRAHAVVRSTSSSWRPARSSSTGKTQADIRVKRPFQIGRLQLEGQFDAYNAFNSGAVLSEVQTFGPNLFKPASILQGRLIRLGVQLKW